MIERIYTGPGKCGICQCGHPVDDHHLSWVMSRTAVEETGEAYIPGACLAYGCNEYEGFDADGNVHCMSYKDRGTETTV